MRLLATTMLLCGLLVGIATAGSLIVGCSGQVVPPLELVTPPGPLVAEVGDPMPETQTTLRNPSALQRSGVASKGPGCPAQLEVSPLGPFTIGAGGTKTWTLRLRTDTALDPWACDSCLVLVTDPLP